MPVAQYIFIFLLLLVTSPVWATTRHVAKAAQGGSDANSCVTSQNVATPKLTLASAVGCMAAGDTLLIRAGTYNESIITTTLTSGSASAYYTFQNYNGEVVTITQNNGGMTNSAAKSYYIFDGLVFDGQVTSDNAVCGAHWSIISGSHDIIIRNSEIMRWGCHGLYIEADNITISNTTIHDQRGANVSGFRHYGMYIHNGSNIVVEDSWIHDNPGGGMQMYPGPINNLIIRRNKLYQNNRYTTSENAAVHLLEDNGQQISNVSITQNEIFNNGLVTGVTSSGIEIWPGITGVTIYHNTIYGNKTWGINALNGTGSLIKNNIVVANGDQISAASGTTFNNIVTGNPTDLMTNPANADFTLKAGSAAINAGETLPGFTYVGAADVGRWEFGSGAPPPDTTPPGAPTGLTVQ
jgi:hypothetical protein